LNATESTGKTALELVIEPSKTLHPDTAAILRELAEKRAKQ